MATTPWRATAEWDSPTSTVEHSTPRPGPWMPSSSTPASTSEFESRADSNSDSHSDSSTILSFSRMPTPTREPAPSFPRKNGTHPLFGHGTKPRRKIYVRPDSPPAGSSHASAGPTSDLLAAMGSLSLSGATSVSVTPTLPSNLPSFNPTSSGSPSPRSSAPATTRGATRGPPRHTRAPAKGPRAYGRANAENNVPGAITYSMACRQPHHRGHTVHPGSNLDDGMPGASARHLSRGLRDRKATPPIWEMGDRERMHTLNVLGVPQPGVHDFDNVPWYRAEVVTLTTMP